MANSESKTSWRTSCWWRGYPTILGDLLPGRWPGSHSKHWRKKPLRFLQKEGKGNNLEISQVTLFLIRPASGETNNQTYKRLYCWSLTEMAKGNRQFQPTWAILSHLNISKKIQKFLWSSHPRGNGWYLITGPQDTSTHPPKPHIHITKNLFKAVLCIQFTCLAIKKSCKPYQKTKKKKN